MISELSNVFSDIYKNDFWTNGSGPGSIPKLNKEFLDYVDFSMKKSAIKSIVDVGCGDFQLFRQFKFEDCTYLGLDLVSGLVDRNISKYKKDGLSFELMPDQIEEIPYGDLYIIKDVLIHLNNNESKKIIESVMNKSKFAIFVNNTVIHEAERIEYNSDIEVGGFRPVDVSAAPFNLDVIESLRYSGRWAYDPRWPLFLARILGKRVWPGEKHIQLVRGNYAL